MTKRALISLLLGFATCELLGVLVTTIATAADSGATLPLSPLNAPDRLIAIVAVHQGAGEDLLAEIENRSARTVIRATPTACATGRVCSRR